MVNVKAMRAESGTVADLEDPTKASELKYDGTRVWYGKENGKAFVKNRENVDYTDRLTDVIEAVETIASDNIIFDGEAVVYNENGRSLFEYSQRRCSTSDPAKQKLLRLKYPVVVETFDLMQLDGKDITSMPWEDRKELVEQMLQYCRSTALHVAPHTIDDKIAMYEDAVKRGEEGVIVKDLHSPYVSSRSTNWLKVKKWYNERCKVVGYTEGEGNRDQKFGSLILARRDDSGQLIYCGKVGSGFNYQEVKHITKILEQGKVKERTVVAVDSTKKSIPYTPVNVELELSVKFFETSKNGVFRMPSVMKDERGENIIFYGANTITGKTIDLRSLLMGVATKEPIR
jgi:bifunctional non-homologous end joining protein LigD